MGGGGGGVIAKAGLKGPKKLEQVSMKDDDGNSYEGLLQFETT